VTGLCWKLLVQATVYQQERCCPTVRFDEATNRTVWGANLVFFFQAPGPTVRSNQPLYNCYRGAVSSEISRQ